MGENKVSGSRKEDPATRIILHVDMDSFYASVEVRSHPDLAGKPVIIGPDPSSGQARGVVLTCTYEARKFGVHSAMPVSRAFRLCPDAIFLPPRHHLYQETSERVMEILRQYGDRFQQVSIDEASLDLTSCRDFRAAETVASCIKNDVFAREGLTCSIGIGPGKVVAKIASDLGKPGGLVVIPPDRVTEVLAPLPVGKIPGIGPKTAVLLEKAGIQKIGDLAKADIQQLIGILGRGAIWCQQLARGSDQSDFTENLPVRSVSREHTFFDDCTDAGMVLATLRAICAELCRELAEQDLFARTVTVKIRSSEFITRTRAHTLAHPTRDPVILEKVVIGLSPPLFTGKKVRLAGIRLSSLVSRGRSQKTIGDFVEKKEGEGSPHPWEPASYDL